MAREAAPGSDVEVAIYGWGLQPIYTSGASAWPITDELFQRLYAGRASRSGRRSPPATRRSGCTSRTTARGIYAIGYPALTLFDHFVHLAELTTLAGAGVRARAAGDALFTRVSRERPRVGRALLREIRASFYRKLFLAFVLASVIPVLTLGARDSRLLRGTAARRRRGRGGAHGGGRSARHRGIATRCCAAAPKASAPVNDDVMVWISQVIDQDVNIFDGPELLATSERDLFASGLLPTRTPDEVYRAIVLERLPSFVDEDQIGAVPLHDCRGAGARRGPGRDPDRAARAAAAGDRARDRTSSIAASTSRRCASSCSAPRSGCRWPSASPIRSGG